MRTMVLVYLPTKLGDFVRANVGKYSSTMEQYMGKIQEFTQNKIGNHAATMKMWVRTFFWKPFVNMFIILHIYLNNSRNPHDILDYGITLTLTWDIRSKIGVSPVTMFPQVHGRSKTYPWTYQVHGLKTLGAANDLHLPIQVNVLSESKCGGPLFALDFIS